MENVFLIGATGFIFLSIYNHRTKNYYSESNSNKFLVYMFVCGILPYACSTTILEFVQGCDVTSKLFFQHKKLVFLVEILLSSICAIFLSLLFSWKWIQRIWIGIKKWGEKYDDELAKRNGLIGYDFSTFIKNENVVILSLKNSKVYVGHVLFIDFLEEISQEQRSIKILPLKSGYRNPDGSVYYNTSYLSAIESESEEIRVEEVFSKIPPLVVLQREVVSYTKYDTELDTHFGHSDND